MTLEEKAQITKRLIDDETKGKFKNSLQKMTRNDVISCKKPDSAYETFLENSLFPITKLLKSKTLKSPWITEGILKF